MSAFFHLDARPEKESQSCYRIWRIGIARDYSIASLAANAWNFKTRFQRFRQLLQIEPPDTPAARRRSDPTPATESSGLRRLLLARPARQFWGLCAAALLSAQR